MNSIWYSLAWKEWHEHKWKLAAITAVLWGITGIVFWFSNPIDVIGSAVGFVTATMAPLAVFVGLCAAANERGRGTLPFLQASPVSMRRAAVTKLVMGILTLVTAIILVELLIWACINLFALIDREYRGVFRVFDRQSLTGRWYFDCFLITTGLAANFFIWSAAAGVNRKDEVSAGAWALAVMAGWGILVFSGYSLFDKYGIPIPEWLKVVATATVPGVCLSIIEPWARHYRLLGLGIALGLHGALAVWYVLRFGRIEKIDVRSPQPAIRDAARAGWLAAPRRSAFTAIAWKQFRESVPLALCGIAGVVAIASVLFLSDFKDFIGRPDRFVEMAAGVTVVIGFIVAIVVGVGVCLHDSSPGLGTFWRSRPINVDQWYWTKYLTSLGTLVTAFYLPTLAIVLTLHPDRFNFIFRGEVLNAQISVFAVFAAAVMTTCLIRHAVYAAILSISVVYIGALAGVEFWYLAGLIGWVQRPPHGVYPQTPVIFGIVLSFVTSTLIAWLAVRYDWGRKGRY